MSIALIVRIVSSMKTSPIELLEDYSRSIGAASDPCREMWTAPLALAFLA